MSTIEQCDGSGGNGKGRTDEGVQYKMASSISR